MTLIRQDGREKVTGGGVYTGDIVLPGMLHGGFVVAGIPSGRIARLDLSAARALPGVVAITQDDVPDRRYGPFIRDRTLFARDVVRYEGEVVAAVAARSEDELRRALALVDVAYVPAEPVTDATRALDDPHRLVHEDWSRYEAVDGVEHEANQCSRTTTVKGDADRVFAEADVVLRERYETDMSHPVPIEPHAIAAQWHGDEVTIWTSSQVPFLARRGVADTLGLDEGRVRVIVPLLGGGFGGKCDFHFEAHVAALARAARRPVRLVLSRREEFLLPDKVRHAITVDLETAAAADGTLLGRRARIVLDGGAYAADTPVMTEMTTMLAVGPYRIPHLDIEARSAYTNKTPAGSVRAPTGPQMCWAVEQHMDALAELLGMDAYELRRRNLVVEGDEGPTRQIYERIGARECLERAAESAGWGDELGPDEGIGLACGFWNTMTSPSGAHVRLNADGSGTIVTGAQENGTGAVMALPLLAAEELGMRPEQFSILAQDTATAPWDHGSAGSQTTVNNGRAVIAAAREVRDRLLDLAETELEIGRDDLIVADGSISARGMPSRSVAIPALAALAQERGVSLWSASVAAPFPRPEHDVSGCVGRFVLGAFSAPTFFCHVARVRVDRETGTVRVLEVHAAHDFGTVLNHAGAVGQVHGGVVHGIGVALLEGTAYRDGRQENPGLLNYKLQVAADMPRVEIAFVDAPAADAGPRGAKGVGEPPMVPTAGAVANAIAAATGARVRRLPMTPERVWEASA